MTWKNGNTLQDYQSHVLILQSDWIWLILWFGLVLFLLKRCKVLQGCHLFKIPAIVTCSGQWLTGQKTTDLFIWGMLFAFQHRKKSRSTPCLPPIHTLVLHICETLGAAVYHPINPIELKGSMPEDCLCHNASALLCFHLQQEKAQTSLTPYLSRLNHLKTFVPKSN